MVLLLVLALGAVSTSALLLVSTQRLLGRAELGYLESRVRAEALLSVSGAGAGATDGFNRVETQLPGNFSLIAATPVESGPSFHAVHWVLNADTIAAGLPGALEVVGPVPEEGVQPLDGCSSAEMRPLISASPNPSPGPDIQGRGGPSLGILGIPELLVLADAELPDPAALPGARSPAVYRALPGTVIEGGQGAGVLIASGDLTLEGPTHFAGLLVVAGELVLRESARVEGVVLVGGAVRISGNVGIYGCPDVARMGLELPTLDRSHPLPGGWLLGRY